MQYDHAKSAVDIVVMTSQIMKKKTVNWPSLTFLNFLKVAGMVSTNKKKYFFHLIIVK
ncbi:hypothetical protein HanPSC8_Chr08g0326301 [Helianthus annuus]|nr:hypothetical protein HanPSC8_Chr08g0326301 [Helianthus annuus]